MPHYPQEDAKQRASSLEIRRGGNCPNSLEVLQQLVGPQDALCMYLVSPLPSKSSLATQHIKESFGESSPVGFQHCLYRETHTQAASSYIFRSKQTGSRTIINYNDLPEMTVDEFEAVVRRFNPGDETWWHFEVSPVQSSSKARKTHTPCCLVKAAPANGRVKRGTPQHLILRHPFNNPCLTILAQGRIPNTTLECVRRLRDKLPNAQISVEVEKPGRDGLRELAAEANVVFYSRSWAEVRNIAPWDRSGRSGFGSPNRFVCEGGLQAQPPKARKEKKRRKKKMIKNKADKTRKGMQKAERLMCIELRSWVCRIVSRGRATTTGSVSVPFFQTPCCESILPNVVLPLIRTWSTHIAAVGPLLYSYALGVRREPPCASRLSRSSTVPLKAVTSPFRSLSRLPQREVSFFRVPHAALPILARRHRTLKPWASFCE